MFPRFNSDISALSLGFVKLSPQCRLFSFSCVSNIAPKCFLFQLYFIFRDEVLCVPVKLHCRNYDLKKIKNILVWILTKDTIFMDIWFVFFFFENKMCFIDSLKSCIILCAVGKL